MTYKKKYIKLNFVFFSLCKIIQTNFIILTIRNRKLQTTKIAMIHDSDSESHNI